jgi:hypothetical protein
MQSFILFFKLLPLPDSLRVGHQEETGRQSNPLMGSVDSSFRRISVSEKIFCSYYPQYCSPNEVVRVDWIII